MAKKILSLILLFSLVLPMSIGLAHAFHNHDDTVCMAVDENHIHSEKTDCDHPHYFSQTLTFKISTSVEVNQLYWSRIDYNYYATIFRSNVANTYAERGPPSFNVL